MALFSKKSICLVTGASKGLGKEIALQLSREWSQAGVESEMVITARNEEALEKTKSLIVSQTPLIRVHVVPGDLGDMAALPALCSRLLEHFDATKHQQCILVNNAGTLNDFETPFLSRNDPNKLQDYFGINVSSMIVLTTRFLSVLPSSQRYVIHITSLMGTMYFKGFPLYSVTKAARNAFMGVLGVEMPDVRQFSYSPGPCDTDMLRDVPEHLKGAHVLTTEESIKRLLEILREDKFENGCIIDYFDQQQIRDMLQ